MSFLNADDWILETLTGDSVLTAALSDRIYQDEAQEGTEYPLITFNFVSGVPVENASADRIMDSEVWRINIYAGEATYKNIAPLADEIRTIFHKASGTGVIGCRYLQTLRIPQVKEGQTRKRIILEFELFTQ